MQTKQRFLPVSSIFQSTPVKTPKRYKSVSFLTDPFKPSIYSLSKEDLREQADKQNHDELQSYFCNSLFLNPKDEKRDNELFQQLFQPTTGIDIIVKNNFVSGKEGNTKNIEPKINKPKQVVTSSKGNDISSVMKKNYNKYINNFYKTKSCIKLQPLNKSCVIAKSQQDLSINTPLLLRAKTSQKSEEFDNKTNDSGSFVKSDSNSSKSIRMVRRNKSARIIRLDQYSSLVFNTD